MAQPRSVRKMKVGGKDGDIQEARANGKTLWGQWEDFVFFSENDGKQLVTFEQRHDLI